MTTRDKVILTVFGLSFVIMMYGVIPWEDMGIGLPTLWWWFPEMTALFILMSVIIGLIGRLSELELTDAFVDGARDLLGCRADHRHRAGHHRDHEQRRRDRHRAALGRAGGRADWARWPS